MGRFEVKNRFEVGDRLEIIHPSGNALLELTAAGNGVAVAIPLAARYQGALIARLLEHPPA